MTDLERKLAEALRGQAGEVTPNLDAAWAEQMRRQRRPRRRRATVWVAPLAAVLVVLTSVLLATQVNNDPAPARPANPGHELQLAKPEHQPFDHTMLITGRMAILTEFAGQTDMWRAWAYTGVQSNAPDRKLFCVAAIPVGSDLTSDAPQYGTKSPQCTTLLPDSGKTVLAGYVGEAGGPLPPGKAVYLVSSTMEQLRLYNAQGDLSQGKLVDRVASSYQVFLADVVPGSPPVRFDVS
jgi:hypothetical protein